LARFRTIHPQEDPDRRRDGSGGDHIESWVKIADHLGRDIKTVQRWEKTSGLPIHRLTTGRARPIVYAYRSELDVWLAARTSGVSAPDAAKNTASPRASKPPKASDSPEPPDEVYGSDEVYGPDEDRTHRRFLVRAAVGVVASLAAIALLWLPGTPPAPEPPASTLFPHELPFTYYEGHEDHAAISPDGRSIAYIWDGERYSGAGDLYVQEIGSEDLRRLTRTLETEVGPEWSPDGTEIAFKRISPETGKCELLTIPVDGGPSRSILTREKCGGLDYLSWSPDGRYLAFTDLESRRVAITLYSFEDDSFRTVKEPSQIPLTPIDQHPVFSPDGRRLVVTRVQDGDLRAVILGLDGEELQNFVTGAKARHVWSADGKSLIFSRRRTHAGELHRISLADGTISSVPYGSSESMNPTVRGDRLAYTRWRYATGLRRADLRDGKIVPGSDRVFAPSSAVDHSPSFSPDGSRLLFVSDRTGTEEIWVCNADGSAVRRLTKLAVRGTGSPRWSPDGEWVAFDSAGGAGQDTAIFVVSSLRGEPRRLTSGKPATRVPAWSSDGEWVYFSSRVTVPTKIWKAPVKGGDLVPVTTNPGFESRETPDGRTLYFASRGYGLGLWARDQTTGEEAPVEALADAGRHRYWSIAGNGLYFVAGDADPSSGAPFEIKRYDLRSGVVTEVGVIDQPLVDGPSGLTVSPDESALIYAAVELDDRDLMLVEGFQ